MNERDKIADELAILVKAWRTASWWSQGSMARIIAIKVWYRLDVITAALSSFQAKKIEPTMGKWTRVSEDEIQLQLELDEDTTISIVRRPKSGAFYHIYQWGRFIGSFTSLPYAKIEAERIYADFVGDRSHKRELDDL